MNKNIKRKKCKACKKLFKPEYSTTTQVCSYRCALSFAKSKKEKDDKDLENARISITKARKEKKQSQTLSNQIKLTRTAVHDYIHERDRGKKCITCPSILTGDFDAGHYYHGSKSNALRFDLDNIHGQCIQCNRRNYGMFQKYTEELPKRIGQEAFNNLTTRYNETQKTIHKWFPDDLVKIRKKARKLMRELKAEKSCLHPVRKVN